MWLKRLVGGVMIVTCIGMNVLVVIGFFSPVKVSKIGFVDAVATLPTPTVTINAKPDAISAGSFSALSWSTTGNPDSCVASGDWSGQKTPFGAESTGRITSIGNRNYTLECSNKQGSAKATVAIAIGPASAAPPTAPKSNSGGSSSSSAVVYCDGATPCYGPKDVGQHSSNGNCWGWNGSRVINISGLDAGFHKAKTGISTIEIGQVCGKDLSSALGGGVSTSDAPARDHNPTTKANADSNERPYFVGYFDASKP